MLYELRTYDFAPGDAIRYLDLFRREGLPLITRSLPLCGYWLTEIGALNRLHHLWVYQDFSDRTAKRAAFTADTEWTEGFLPRGLAMIRRQESRLLDLVKGSASLHAVAADAARPHAAESVDKPLLASSWAVLSFGGTSTDTRIPGLIGAWKVVAGDGRGSIVALAQFDAAATISTDGATALQTDVCRPCGFSPLQ